MHPSLIPERAHLLDELAEACGYAGPVFDAHVHFAESDENRLYLRTAARHGVTGALAMLHGVSPGEILSQFGGQVLPVAWLHLPETGGKAAIERWRGEALALLETAPGEGVRAIKTRSHCKQGRPEVFLDHPGVAEVLERIADAGLPLMVHVGDPLRWWGTLYDPAEVGGREAYLQPVLNVLRAHPQLRLIGAHMLGLPEDPARLNHLLSEHANLFLDTSATKWIVRELGLRREAARALVLKHPGRILFGSDLVAMVAQGEADYYASRLAVLRYFLEGAEERPSPIADPDATGAAFPDGPVVRPLALSGEVLAQVYRGAAQSLFGLDG
jgi:hypothetical protein